MTLKSLCGLFVCGLWIVLSMGCTAQEPLKPCVKLYSKDGKAVGTELSVISFNIRMAGNPRGDGENAWPKRKRSSIEMVLTERPALFGLQEAFLEQVRYLDRNLSGYDWIGVGRDDGEKAGEFMALFYDKASLELGENGTFWLSETPDSVSRGWDAACHRTCTWAVFTIRSSGQRFCCFNTHLDHMGEVARRESILLLVSRMEAKLAEKIPVILMADFNSETTNPIFAPLGAVMSDARVESPETDTRGTYNGWGSADAVIDHIFYQAVTPLRFEVLRSNYGAPYISDHYPVKFTAVIPY